MSAPFEGGCLCGAVRYHLMAPPNYVYFCHCRDCQRESGSPFVTDMNIDRAAVAITGLLTRYTRTGDSGKGIVLVTDRENAVGGNGARGSLRTRTADLGWSSG